MPYGYFVFLTLVWLVDKHFNYQSEEDLHNYTIFLRTVQEICKFWVGFYYYNFAFIGSSFYISQAVAQQQKWHRSYSHPSSGKVCPKRDKNKLSKKSEKCHSKWTIYLSSAITIHFFFSRQLCSPFFNSKIGYTFRRGRPLCLGGKECS